MSPTYSVRQVTSPEDIQTCIDVRFQVYHVEMGFPVPGPEDMILEREEDAQCVHLLCEATDLESRIIPVGAVRLFLPTNKLGRLAVLKEYRLLGLAAKLISAVSAWAKEDARKKGEKEAVVFCHAFASVSKLYEKVGYVPEGPIFEEIWIPHQNMVLEITV